MGSRLLAHGGADVEKVRAAVSGESHPAAPTPDEALVDFDSEARSALQASYRVFAEGDDSAVDSGHLLLGLLSLPQAPLVETLKEYGVTREKVAQALTDLRESEGALGPPPGS